MGLLVRYEVNKIIEEVNHVKKTRTFKEEEFELLSNEMPSYITGKAGVVQVDAGNGMARLNFRSRVLLVRDGVLSEPYALFNMIETKEGMLVRFIEEDDIDYFDQNTKIYGQYIDFGVHNVFEYHLDNGNFNAISFIFDYGSDENFLMIASFHIEPYYNNIKKFYNDAKGL